MANIQTQQKNSKTIGRLINSSALEFGYKIGLIYSICFLIFSFIEKFFLYNAGMMLLALLFNPTVFRSLLWIFSLVSFLWFFSIIYYLVLVFKPSNDKVKIDKNYFHQNPLKCICFFVFEIISIFIFLIFVLAFIASFARS